MLLFFQNFKTIVVLKICESIVLVLNPILDMANNVNMPQDWRTILQAYALMIKLEFDIIYCKIEALLGTIFKYSPLLVLMVISCAALRRFIHTDSKYRTWLKVWIRFVVIFNDFCCFQSIHYSGL